jgi:hypothetical protein
MCIGCGKDKDRKGKYCSGCLERYNYRRKKLINDGICPSCKLKNDRKNGYCSLCYKKYQDQKEQKIKQCIDLGICTYKNCKNPIATKGNKMPACFDCWIKTLAQRHFVDPELLIKLWNKQDGKCYYTGINLIPGRSNDWKTMASLDHIIPSKRGGTNEENNLRWVSYLINTMKSNMTHLEFLETCQTICKNSQ